MNTEHHFNFPKERVRFAALTFFLAQGLCFSSWASRIPDIKDAFNVIDTFWWGLILFMIPVGKVIAIPLAGYTVPRLGSKLMVQVSILGYALALFLAGAAPSIYVLGGSLFLFGIFWNLCDISLNTQAIGIEKAYGKTIMASFHGGWSLAACIGALIGFVMINLQVSPFYHYSFVSIAVLLQLLINRNYLQKDAAPVKTVEEVKATKSKKFRMPELLLLQLGLMGLFALIVESAMFDWGGIYFESIVKVPKSLQIGFLVFMVMMTIGRFLTNVAYQFWGKKKVIQLAGSLICAGLFLSALFPNIYTSSLGFMMVGLGISCMVPTIYSVVGEKSTTPTGIALTILSSISFLGSLVAPLLIGFISHTFNLKYAYMVVALFGACIVIMVSNLKVFKE